MTAVVREGHVVAHDGLLTELALTTPCRSCQSRCLLGSIAKRRLDVVPPRGLRLSVGQRIHIAVSRSELTRTCALLFGVPLSAWVCGGVLGSHLWGETGAALLALTMLTGALLGLSANRRSLRRRVKLELIASAAIQDAGHSLSGVD